MRFVRHVAKLDKRHVSTAGGKGASLGEMTKAGIPIPSGFVVLASAFAHFLAEAKLNTKIEELFRAVDQEKTDTIGNASTEIQNLIFASEVPRAIEKEVQAHFEDMGSVHVAVRSSATSEDSASAAWAGQLDTFLNTTRDTLIENVRRCWASLFTPRAIFYRIQNNLHEKNISVAVVVQKMVESESSGVAFSVHPVTEDHRHLVIEAGFGLGEAIVSGHITPDSYVVAKNPRRIISKDVSIQEKLLRRSKAGGNEWRKLSKKEGGEPVLTDEQIHELADLVLKIEAHHGFPVDVEWAHEGGKFYITQSRPITTLSRRA